MCAMKHRILTGRVITRRVSVVILTNDVVDLTIPFFYSFYWLLVQMEVHSQEYQGQLGRHPTHTKESESRNLDTYVYIFLELKHTREDNRKFFSSTNLFSS